MKRSILLGAQVFVASALILSVLCIPGHSQNLRPMRQAVDVIEMGLTAHGHAEIKARPDIAFATIGVTTQSRDQSEAVQENATRTKKVMDALTGSGIASKDIQTNYYAVQPQYDYNTSPPIRTGYQVVNNLRVKIRDLAKAGLILDKATAAGASEVDGLSFDLEDHHKVEGQALAAAVADARRKAKLMAQAADVGLGHLLSLSEGAVPPVQPIYAGAMMRATAEAASAPPTPISPQEITVTADVTAAFAIAALP